MHRHEASVRSGQHRHAALTPGAFLNAGPGDWGHSRTLAQASDSVMGFPSADGALGNEFDARALYRATSGVEFDRIRSDDSDLASVVELVDVGGGHKGTEEAVVRCVVGPVTVTTFPCAGPSFPTCRRAVARQPPPLRTDAGGRDSSGTTSASTAEKGDPAADARSFWSLSAPDPALLGQRRALSLTRVDRVRGPGTRACRGRRSLLGRFTPCS